ncbi:hypothetical protein EJB05_18309, partial [Eragrostis curvula]|jgi:DNA polymerase-3 subunit epsilon
MLAKP